MVAETFLDAFLPGLAATLVGVAIGVPVALWFDRKTLARSEAAEQSRERQRLKTAIDAVHESVNANLKAIDELGLPQRESMTMVTDLTTSVWEALKADVMKGLSDDPALRAVLAQFFHQVGQVEQLHDQLRSIRLPTWIAEHGELQTTGEVAGVLSANIGSLQAQGDLINALLTERESPPSSPE